jgi:hypothetical protein
LATKVMSVEFNRFGQASARAGFKRLLEAPAQSFRVNRSATYAFP